MACDCLYVCIPYTGYMPSSWVLQGITDNTDPFPPGGLAFTWGNGYITTATGEPPFTDPIDDGRDWSVGIATTDVLTMVSRYFTEHEMIFEATIDISVMPGENYFVPGGGIAGAEDETGTFIECAIGVEIGSQFRAVIGHFEADRSLLGGPASEATVGGVNGVTAVTPVGVGPTPSGSYTIRLTVSSTSATAEIVGLGSVALDPWVLPMMAPDLDATPINFQLSVAGNTFSATETDFRMNVFTGGSAEEGVCGPWSFPLVNAYVENERGPVGDGIRTIFTTVHHYNPVSLEVEVAGILTQVDTSDPENHEYTFEDPPPVGAEIRATYQAAVGPPTMYTPGTPIAPGPPPPRPPGAHFNGPVYGPGVAMDSKSNSRVGQGQKTAVRYKQSTTSTISSVALNWRSDNDHGYSSGNGGIIRLSLYTDGAGVPGTLIGTPFTYTPAISGAANEDMTPLSTPGDWTAVTDRIVWVVQENIDSSPFSNWLSVNHTTVLEGGDTSPAFDDTFAVMTDNYGAGWGVFGDLPVIDVEYADTTHDGNAYFGVIVTSDFSTVAVINGSAQARQTLNPTADVTVYSMWVRVKHISGPGSLTITLDGPDIPVVVSGGDIATTPYSSSWTVADLTGGRWVGGAITGGFTLLNGSTYYLRMETVPGTTYLAIPIRVADSPWASYAYYDGEAQKSPDGSTWSANYGGALNSWQTYLGKAP